MKRPNQNDKEKDAPKGKRKLEFKEKKSEKTRLPLSDKIILVDLKDGPQKKKIEADLKILGARVDTFLSKDIHYLITGQPRPVSSRDDQGQSPASPADVNTPSPFNCGPSPSPTMGGGKQAPPETVPRGKAIAQRAKNTRQLEVTEDLSQLVVRNAEKFGVKIVALDSALKWIQRELAKLPASALKASDHQKGRNQVKLKMLKSPFIKFEAASLQYKAIQQHLDVWPRANTDTPRGTCPFDGNGMRRGDRSREERGERIGLIPLEPVMSDTPSKEEESKTTPHSKSKSTKKRHNTSIVGGVRILTAGEIRRQKEMKRIQDRRRGYCECCEDKYEDLHKHVRDEKHKSFVRDKKNYEKLDVLIRTGPDVASFIQRVVLRQCSKKSAAGNDSIQKEKDTVESPTDKNIKRKRLTTPSGNQRRKISLRKDSPQKISRHSPHKVCPLKEHVSAKSTVQSKEESVGDKKPEPHDSNQESVVENIYKRSPRKSPRKSPFMSKSKIEQEDGHSLESHFFPARTRNFIVVHHKSPKAEILARNAGKAGKEITLSRENKDTVQGRGYRTGKKTIAMPSKHSQGSKNLVVESCIEEQFNTKLAEEKNSPITRKSGTCTPAVKGTCTSELVQKKELSNGQCAINDGTEKTAQLCETENLPLGAIDAIISKNGAITDDTDSLHISKSRRKSLNRENKSGANLSTSDSPCNISTSKHKNSKNSNIRKNMQKVDGDVGLSTRTVEENDVPAKRCTAKNTTSPEVLSSDAENRTEGSRKLRNRGSQNHEKNHIKKPLRACNEDRVGTENKKNNGVKEVAIKNGNQVLSSSFRIKMSLATNTGSNEQASAEVTSVVNVDENPNITQNQIETSPKEDTNLQASGDTSVISPSHYQEHLLVASDFVDKMHRLRATNRRIQIVDEKVKILSEGSPKTVTESPKLVHNDSNIPTSKRSTDGAKDYQLSASFGITNDKEQKKCIKDRTSVPGSPKFNKSPAFKSKMKKISRNTSIRNLRKSEPYPKNPPHEDFELISASSSPCKENVDKSEKINGNSSQKSEICVHEKGKVTGVVSANRKRKLAVQKSRENKTPRRSSRSSRENGLSNDACEAVNEKRIEKVDGRKGSFERSKDCEKIVQDSEFKTANSQKGVRKSARNTHTSVADSFFDSKTVHQGLEVSEKDDASCSALHTKENSNISAGTTDDKKFVAIKKLDPSTPILKTKPSFDGSGVKTSLLSPEIKTPSKSPRIRQSSGQKKVKKTSASPFSLTWHNAKGYTPKGKAKKVSLNKSWKMLSNRSVAKLFQNDPDEEVFEGFEPLEVNGEKAVVSEASYVETTEVEFENDSDREWYVEEEEDDNNLSAYVPNILSSPGFKSDSSWGEACADFINSKANSSLLTVSSPRKSPLKVVKSLMKSPQGKCKSNVTSTNRQKKCEKRKRLQSQETDNTAHEAKNSFTPKRKKLSRSPNVTFMMEDGVTTVDEDIEFNYMSPQKLKNISNESDGQIVISSSPLQENAVLKTSTPHARVERRSIRGKKALNLSNVSTSNNDEIASATGSQSFPMLEHRSGNNQENTIRPDAEGKCVESKEPVARHVQRRSGRLHRS